MIWWHEYVLKHKMFKRRVSVPIFDPSAKGILVDCQCGKSWAK